MNGKWKIAAAALGGMVVTAAAGGIAVASMDKGLGRFGNADANNDGQVTQQEWLQAATTRFQALDVNKDGKLAVGELPPQRGWRGHGPRHGGHGPHGFEPDADAPPPGALDQSADPAANAATPAAK